MYYDIESANLLFNEAVKKNLNPKRLSKYGLFVINVKGSSFPVFYSSSILNTQLASTIATNKYSTRLILDENDLPNIPYCLPEDMASAAAFLNKHKSIIAKPTLGKHSTDIHLIKNKAELEGLNLRTYILEKYIEGKELRILILNHQVIAVHEKLYPAAINNPETVTRVSYPKSTWPKQICEVALAAAKSIGLNFCAVDFLINDKDFYILEINSAPGLRWFQKPSSGPTINIASIFLDETIKAF